MDHYQQHNCPHCILSSHNIPHENDVGCEYNNVERLDNEESFVREIPHVVRKVAPRIYEIVLIGMNRKEVRGVPPLVFVGIQLWKRRHPSIEYEHCVRHHLHSVLTRSF